MQETEYITHRRGAQTRRLAWCVQLCLFWSSLVCASLNDMLLRVPKRPELSNISISLSQISMVYGHRLGAISGATPSRYTCSNDCALPLLALNPRLPGSGVSEPCAVLSKNQSRHIYRCTRPGKQDLTLSQTVFSGLRPCSPRLEDMQTLGEFCLPSIPYKRTTSKPPVPQPTSSPQSPLLFPNYLPKSNKMCTNWIWACYVYRLCKHSAEGPFTPRSCGRHCAPPQLMRGKGKLPIVQVDGKCANCARFR
ncbi:hypothetical protein R3P38DRAFT_3357478 [Favolaschia claudopus]|uniref:Uncharacterized protein n=1 Tax=Favolaschia claudopus TaxID=2862362 RepID=A0AAW0BBN0_9AGAR